MVNWKIAFHISIFAVVSTSYSCNESDCIRAVRTKVIRDEFNGVVEMVISDPDNRGTPSVILKSTNKKYPADSRELYLFVEQGDSIVKKKGSVKFTVYRNGKEHFFYPGCGDLVVTDSGEFYRKID